MNNDLEQFSEERLKELLATGKYAYNYITSMEMRSLIHIALAAKQAKPIGYVESKTTGTDRFILKGFYAQNINIGDSLYTTPQPAHTEQDGWIKCSDDLPLIGVEVQVYIPGNDQAGRPTVTAMSRFINRQGAPDYFWDKSTGKGGMTLDTSVTHWRPLAAAPKPDGTLISEGTKNDGCQWNRDENLVYSTGCGNEWQFTDGGLEDNQIKFCPYCSGKIAAPKPEIK